MGGEAMQYLECAPIPIAGHADGHLRLRLARRGRARAGHGAGGDGAGWHGLRAAMGLKRATGPYTRRGRVAPAPPGLKLEEAVVASADGVAARVEVCALIEGHELHRVRVAKDVAAAAAVVPSDKIVEVLFAGWVIADFRVYIGL